jgi:hypothetical protein
VVSQSDIIPVGGAALAIIVVVVGVALVMKRRQRFDGADEFDLESI